MTPPSKGSTAIADSGEVLDWRWVSFDITLLLTVESNPYAMTWFDFEKALIGMRSFWKAYPHLDFHCTIYKRSKDHRNEVAAAKWSWRLASLPPSSIER